ncbi:MAG: hypothetical protein LC117_04130 [Bacteroidia bacterium]|nr:hypothetical protein [Bacteroidia bacterium]MCZ2277097.1 hypothetical protein [Bacteroidia bacterium]
MEESKSKDKVLKKLRQALLDKTAEPRPEINFNDHIFNVNREEFPEVIFAEKFFEKNGNFNFCESPEELYKSILLTLNNLKIQSVRCIHPEWKSKFEKAGIQVNNLANNPEVSFSTCFGLTAYPCSIIIADSCFFSPGKIHFIMATPDQCYYELKEGLHRIKKAVLENQAKSFDVLLFDNKEESVEQSCLLPESIFLFLVDSELT